MSQPEFEISRRQPPGQDEPSHHATTPAPGVAGDLCHFFDHHASGLSEIHRVRIPAMEIAISLVVAYLLGCTSPAYLIGRWRRGIDLRVVDVRNVGAGAVMRQVGRLWGSLVIILDMSKGAAAILIAQRYFELSEPMVLLTGFFAILGHNFPFWLRFRGGAGVACFMGVIMVLSPLAMAATFGALGLALLLTRQLFTTIALASPFLLVFVYVMERDPVTNAPSMMFYFSLGVALFILLRNRRRVHEIRTFTRRAYYDVRSLLGRGNN